MAVLFFVVPFPRKCLKTLSKKRYKWDLGKSDINGTAISKEAVFPCVDIGSEK